MTSGMGYLVLLLYIYYCNGSVALKIKWKQWNRQNELLYYFFSKTCFFYSDACRVTRILFRTSTQMFLNWILMCTKSCFLCSTAKV